GLQHDGEGAREFARIEDARDAVGEAGLAAHDLHQPRGEAAAAQNIIHYLNFVEVRVRPRDPDKTQHDVRLLNVSVQQLEVESAGKRGRIGSLLGGNRSAGTRQFLIQQCFNFV